MKRLFAILLCLSFLLCGCQKQNTAKFYYERNQFQYGVEDGVFVAEERDLTGVNPELAFLLNLYLLGPHSADYKMPFDGKAKLLAIEKAESLLTLTFTESSLFLSDMQFTLSCVSLAMTCMELTDAECITIQSGNRVMSLTRDVLTLYDSGLPTAATEGVS